MLAHGSHISIAAMAVPSSILRIVRKRLTADTAVAATHGGNGDTLLDDYLGRRRIQGDQTDNE